MVLDGSIPSCFGPGVIRGLTMVVTVLVPSKSTLVGYGFQEGTLLPEMGTIGRSECGLASFDPAITKGNGLGRASGFLIRGLLLTLFALNAHAEDAGEAVRSTQSLGKADPSSTFETICRTLKRSAANNNLPIEFFTQVIWQESRFRCKGSQLGRCARNSPIHASDGFISWSP